MVGRSRQRDQSSASQKTIPGSQPLSGLGADEKKVEDTMDDDKSFCTVCSDQAAVFGMEDGAEGELNVSDEGEQAVRVASAYPVSTYTHSVFGSLCHALLVPVVVPVLRGRLGPRVRP